MDPLFLSGCINVICYYIAASNNERPCARCTNRLILAILTTAHKLFYLLANLRYRMLLVSVKVLLLLQVDLVRYTIYM